MFLEQQISILEMIILISDTEDCSNDAENSALITGILNYIIIQNSVYFTLLFYCICDQICFFFKIIDKSVIKLQLNH